MGRLGTFGWLMLLACTSCARVSPDTDEDAATPKAGAPATGDTTGQGGDDETVGASCPGSGPSCLSDWRSFQTATDSICVDGHWVCPSGTQPFDDCPANACVRRTQSCCAPNGENALPDCNDDGTIGACPAGFVTENDKCLPQGVPIHDCSELQVGQACTDPSLVCYTGKCSRNCSCQKDEAGKLSWSCHAVPC